MEAHLSHDAGEHIGNRHWLARPPGVGQPKQQGITMIWARKTIESGEWQEVQDQFEDLFTKLGCPGQMMLVAVSSHDPAPATLLASLPNAVLLSSLAGFESISEGDLPSEASLLIGHNRQFEQHFRYPVRHLGI
ncbi:hypothetical protein [Microvirga puerhi]|uniref:Uncharacterized protein n=1 Tax=Microvirga puerhi TaxID=2876078 RepID=A0ABS7VS81_9HYPH|nr:hypothetical protein [Microvirga puerhi]MBZ6078069.1 hypothetical protein [Microvirga puerhi]